MEVALALPLCAFCFPQFLLNLQWRRLQRQAKQAAMPRLTNFDLRRFIASIDLAGDRGLTPSAPSALLLPLLATWPLWGR